MHKQSRNAYLLKTCNIATRLHNAPVFLHCKPINEKVRLNLLYRGALLWNGLPVNVRNMDFNDFKKSIIKNRI